MKFKEGDIIIYTDPTSRYSVTDEDAICIVRGYNLEYITEQQLGISILNKTDSPHYTEGYIFTVEDTFFEKFIFTDYTINNVLKDGNLNPLFVDYLNHKLYSFNKKRSINLKCDNLLETPFVKNIILNEYVDIMKNIQVVNPFMVNSSESYIRSILYDMKEKRPDSYYNFKNR